MTDSEVMPVSFGTLLLGTLALFVFGAIVWLLSFRALERGFKRDSKYFGVSDRIEVEQDVGGMVDVDERAIGA